MNLSRPVAIDAGRLTCAFCPDAAEVVCGAMVLDTAVILPAEIQPGDFYCSAPDLVECLVLGVEVTTLVARFGGDWSSEPLWILHVRSGASQRLWYESSPDLPVLVRRRLPCGRACCFKHYREIDDNLYRCKDHWMIGAERDAGALAPSEDEQGGGRESAKEHGRRKIKG